MSKRTQTTAAAHQHEDKRLSIPTQELRGFVDKEEQAPGATLYPRDPSLDPQLVWKGKDEQDRADLSVPTVPVYIQETIHPQAIIEAFRNDARTPGEQESPNLFEALDVPFEDRVDFYHHEEDWKNRMILGDSLLVMNSLAHKEGLRGRVQMIYLDPPYGIKFGSNWQMSTRKKEVKDGRVEDATRQPEQIKAYRDTWKKGIHSYLAYLRDRLVIGRELLTESGSIFIQIGDANVHLVRSLLDEVFGSENFVSLITIRKTSGGDFTYLPGTTDFVLFYAKNIGELRFREVFASKEGEDEGADRYDQVLLPDGRISGLSAALREFSGELPEGARRYQLDNLTSDEFRPDTTVPFVHAGKTYYPGKNAHWKTSLSGLNRLTQAARLEGTGKGTLRYRRFLEDFPMKQIGNLWSDISGSVQSRTDPKIYVVQSSTALIQRCLLMTTDPGDLVLDPTCGSGTTAYVAEQWGRRWITCDTSRVALALARTRLMTGRFPYFLLADSPEGQAKERDLTGILPSPGATSRSIRKGFVLRRVTRIKLGGIAGNPRIDEIHEEYEPRLETLRATLNQILKKAWERWEIPGEAEAKWSSEAKKAHAAFWELRRARQKAMDEAIALAGNQDPVYLFDQPYEDKTRVRVSGAFTVESLSPHRMLTADENKPQAEVRAQAEASGTFHQMLLENLRKAGVQNTKKDERIRFESLEPHGGAWIHALGAYEDAKGRVRRVALTFGPEHGTLGPDQVREAAKEAMEETLKTEDEPLLLACGYAFDPYLTDDVKKYGRLTVLPVKLSPELLLGQNLKATGAGNLFMVFGEPDIRFHSAGDGKIQVEIKGLDVYDPITGEVRGEGTTDDVACWFLDTEYNGELFVVRHAYFTGADEPYERLKRALRAEVREDAWEQIYTTTSRPFDPPVRGKIAVKVINHYGDEVLKVYDLAKAMEQTYPAAAETLKAAEKPKAYKKR
jgi:adenine-specific DNA-methyltransferase